MATSARPRPITPTSAPRTGASTWDRGSAFMPRVSVSRPGARRGRWWVSGGCRWPLLRAGIERHGRAARDPGPSRPCSDAMVRPANSGSATRPRVRSAGTGQPTLAEPVRITGHPADRVVGALAADRPIRRSRTTFRPPSEPGARRIRVLRASGPRTRTGRRPPATDGPPGGPKASGRGAAAPPWTGRATSWGPVRSGLESLLGPGPPYRPPRPPRPTTVPRRPSRPR